jgi:two-component system response regulator HydG
VPTRILVVDDEKNIRTTLADILSEKGYEVSTAGTGERAVKLCSKRVFDVVLLDVRMPGIDGVEAFRRIRAIRREVRVILMSAYSIDEMRREALAAGALAFMRKPLDLERLARLIGGGVADRGASHGGAV